MSVERESKVSGKKKKRRMALGCANIPVENENKVCEMHK